MLIAYVFMPVGMLAVHRDEETSLSYRTRIFRHVLDFPIKHSDNARRVKRGGKLPQDHVLGFTGCSR